MNSFAAIAGMFALIGSLFGNPQPAPDPATKLSDGLLGELAAAPDGAAVSIIASTDGPAAARAERAAALGLEVVWTYGIIDGFSAKGTPDEVLALAHEPWILGIEDDAPVQALMDVSTRDIEATKAWAAGYRGAGVTVAVIDTGIETTDFDLADAVVGCVSLVLGIELPECDDTDGHGTHVAGSVASRAPDYPGVAPEAMLVAVRVLHAAGAGTESDVIAGMDWVAQNKDTVSPPIRVATMSIGDVDPGCGDGRDASARAADALVARGVTFTVAAGNAGHKKCTVDGASAAFNVITVGAADDRDTPDPSDDRLADFSSAGPTKDGRLKPEVVAPGVGIWSLFLGPTVARLDGTSMATPHVAGLAALLLDQNAALTPADVKARVTSTTLRPSAAPTLPQEDWGHGLVNACRALAVAGCA